MSELLPLRREADAPAEPPKEPKVDPDAGWIELRASEGNGDNPFVQWHVRINCKEEYGYRGEEYREKEHNLCVIRVRVLGKKFVQRCERAKQRAIEVLDADRAQGRGYLCRPKEKEE